MVDLLAQIEIQVERNRIVRLQAVEYLHFLLKARAFLIQIAQDRAHHGDTVARQEAAKDHEDKREESFHVVERPGITVTDDVEPVDGVEVLEIQGLLQVFLVVTDVGTIQCVFDPPAPVRMIN